MNPRLKQALLVVGFLAIVAGLAFALYYVFFREEPSQILPEPTPIPGAPLPSAGTGRPTTTVSVPGALPSAPTPAAPPSPLAFPSPEAAEAPRTTVLNENVSQAISLSQSGGVRLYDSFSGRFFRITDEGQRIPLGTQTFFNVADVAWANSSDKAVLTYPDGFKTLYDFTTGQQVTLPKHWESFQFSPQDDKIIAKSMGNNEDNRFLVIANPDGTNAEAVEALGTNADRVQVSWSPNNQVVAFAQTAEGIGFDRQQILLVGKNRENFKALVVEGRGFLPSWSPSGENVLYSVYDGSSGFRPSLWISGASGDNVNANRRNIQLQTWADKCTWKDEQTVFCAVPTQLPEGAGLQRSVADGIPDQIYRVDLATGQTVNLGQPDGNPTINRLLIAPDGRAVYYNDRITGRLVRYALP